MNYNPFHSAKVCLEVLRQVKCYFLDPKSPIGTFDCEMISLLDEAICALEAIVDSDQAYSDSLKVAILKMSGVFDSDDGFILKKELKAEIKAFLKPLKRLVAMAKYNPLPPLEELNRHGFLPLDFHPETSESSARTGRN